ncbi:MAG: HypC/HybG/HupF family hydrogenase formation chaperone [Methylomicrobium sp.]|nr:HypC/HybG/HupF family hydrogenase formation chaperone [Methylomicrobium sp.]
MCLAFPMQIVEINGFEARCLFKGIQRTVSLFLIQDEEIQVGDYVLIHVGYALQKVDEEEAFSTWELLDQLAVNESDYA